MGYIPKGWQHCHGLHSTAKAMAKSHFFIYTIKTVVLSDSFSMLIYLGEAILFFLLIFINHADGMIQSVSRNIHLYVVCVSPC